MVQKPGTQLAGTSKVTPVKLQTRNKEQLQKQQLMYTNDTKCNNTNASIKYFSHMTNARQPGSGTNVHSVILYFITTNWTLSNCSTQLHFWMGRVIVGKG